MAGCAANLKPLFTGFKKMQRQDSVGPAGQLTLGDVVMGSWDPGLTICHSDDGLGDVEKIGNDGGKDKSEMTAIVEVDSHV